MTRAHLVAALALAAVIFAAGLGSAWAWRSALAEAELASLSLDHEKERGEISKAVAAELQCRAKDRQELQAAVGRHRPRALRRVALCLRRYR